MRTLLLTLGLLSLLVPARAVRAGDVLAHKSGRLCCPACDYECEFSVEKTKETKTCYEVECKPICIPRVTFPWEKKHAKGGDCYSKGCAKVKVVKVLKKEEYECSRCKCVWTPVPIKGHDGKDGYQDGYPGAGDLKPPPVPVEAGLDRAHLAAPRPLMAPPSAEQNAAPPRQTYWEILTGFFK